MKCRITVSVASEVLEQLDRTPGASRSEKVEDLLRLGLAAQEYQGWVRELRAFYDAGPDADDRQEDLEWQMTADEVLARDD